MAVVIDFQAFRDSLPPGACEAAAELRRSGGVEPLEQVDGGVQAVVRDGRGVYQPWVGVIDREFTAECECLDGQEWCAHAVAVALTAEDRDIDWSAAASDSGEVPDAYARYVAAAERMSPQRLAALVADQAVQDQLFAARLLKEADGIYGASGV